MTERLIAVLASYNRVERTLACLESLFAQRIPDWDVEVSAVLLDDASPDGTSAAVSGAFPSVRVLHGDGSMFWNGGMRAAFAVARQEDPDLYLWLNDDVTLDPGALGTLLATRARLRARGDEPAVVSGSVRDPVTGRVTYGGVRRNAALRPLRFDLVQPGEEPVEVETMHGNCVLLSREVVRRTGDLEPGYSHAMGDLDYGLRARAAGCSVWLTPGTVGTCPDNPGVEMTGTLTEQWHRLHGVKGLPPADWRIFARRWAGPAWPVYWASPYVRRMSRSVARRLRPASRV